MILVIETFFFYDLTTEQESSIILVTYFSLGPHKADS